MSSLCGDRLQIRDHRNRIPYRDRPHSEGVLDGQGRAPGPELAPGMRAGKLGDHPAQVLVHLLAGVHLVGTAPHRAGPGVMEGTVDGAEGEQSRQRLDRLDPRSLRSGLEDC